MNRKTESSQRSLSFCRACLMSECRLYNIHEYKLGDAFCKISGTPLQARGELPQYLCIFCFVMLLKCSAFRDMCHRAQKIIPELLKLKGELNTDYIRKCQLSRRSLNLKQTEVEIVNIPLERNVKCESDEDTLVERLDETYPDIEPEINHVKTQMIDNQFDDLIELKDGVISKRKIEIINENKVVKNKGETNIKPVVKVDAGEISDDNNDDNNLLILKDVSKRKLENTQDIDVHNENLKTGQENKMKMMTIEVKNDKIEFKVADDSDDNEEVHQEKLKAKTNREKSVSKHALYPRSDFNVANFESKYNVKVVTLSKEEQLEEIALRKKSPNYLGSRFRCEECGKGFGEEVPFKNHLARHSLSAGPHVCDICAMRFKMGNRAKQHRIRHKIKFVCTQCEFVSRVREQARKHHEQHAGKTYECPHCEKSFIKSSTYFSHVRLAHPAHNVACGECGETFVSQYGLKQHNKLTHAAKSQHFKCDTCSAKFVSVEALNRHLETAGEHSDLRPCEQCGENCASEHALQKHLGESHPSEARRCEECEMTFSNLAAYDTHHRRKHLGERYGGPPRAHPQRRNRKRGPAAVSEHRSCVCDQCGATVRNKSFLVYHMRSHLAVRPFACPHCPKTFVVPHRLKYHMRSHTGEKPYQCTECPRAFSLKNNLDRHHKTVHLGVRESFPCPVCARASTTRGSVRAHVRAVHGREGWPKRQRKRDKALDNK